MIVNISRHLALAASLSMTIFLALPLGAQEKKPTKWLHIFRNDNSFTSMPADKADNISFSLTEDNRPAAMVVETTDGEKTEVPVSAIDRWNVGNDVPKLIITTDPVVDDVTSKEEYLSAKVEIKGQGIIGDLAATDVSIKGRGNSTWRPDDGIKLPYRLKFGKKLSLAGMSKAKNYVLLANYFDHSLMRNAVAMEVARQLGIKYVNHMVPVDVEMNGKYKGSYQLTEKVGINSGSMSDIDEKNSILFELDNQYDEKYCYTSPVYQLPVMVKDPDITDGQWEEWQDDFSAAEKLVSEGRAAEAFDAKDCARYMLMFSICANRELRFPKSCYIYKTKPADGSPTLYHFGPVWDFDMGFGNVKEDNYTALIENVKQPLFTNMFLFGSQFFKALCSQDEIKAAMKEVADEFVKSGAPDKIMAFYDNYAKDTEATWARDMTAERQVGWRTYQLDHDYIKRLREWIKSRMDFVLGDSSFGLF